MKRLRLLAVCLACLPGCGSDSTGPGALSEVEIQAPSTLASFLLNDSAQLSVIGRDRGGNIHTPGPRVWRSTNATVVAVDTLGLVVGKGVGTATIIVTVGDLSDSLSITVSGTRHRVDISASETWTLAGSPHVVRGALNVTRPTGTVPVLTIEAGATVIFADGSGLTFGLGGRGLLRAMGTVAAPIVLRDTATVAKPGAWIGLTFRSRDTSELHNITLRGCGGTRTDNSPGCLVLGHYIFGPFPTLRLDNVTVENGAGGAVLLFQKSHFAAGSSALSVRGMRGHVATLPAAEVTRFPSGGTFAANDTNEIRLTGDTLRDSATWMPAIPWVVLHPVYIEGTRQPVLTIPAGVTLAFDVAASLVVGKNGAGGLRIGVDGGATTTLRPRGTDWAGVAFWPGTLTSSISNAELVNCGNFSDTGYGQACVSLVGNFYGTAPSPVLKSVTIRGASGVGVNAIGGGGFGTGSANVTITGTAGTIGAPLWFWESSPTSIPSGTYTGNAIDVIYVPGSSITSNDTLHERGIPYLFTQGLGVGHAVDPTLTIEPGVVLKFGPGSGLYVGQLVTGAIRAVGTAAQPIVITGQYPNPGAGLGVHVGPYADSTTLFEHVVVEYGGYEVARDIGAVIRNSLIRLAGGCAITRLSGSSWTTDFTAPALNNTFENNAGPDQCGP